MAEIQVQNVVASASIGREIDLDAIRATVHDSEYEPEQFPGLVYRVADPKTSTLVFRSGKVVCTGAKSVADASRAVDRLVSDLRAHGIDGLEGKPEITVQNIVATASLGADLNLNAVAVGLGLENIEYEPEQFPGLVYRVRDPKVVLLLFGSGKLVCAGARTVDDAARAVDLAAAELSSLGLLNVPAPSAPL